MLDGGAFERVVRSKRITADDARQIRASLYNDGVAEAGELERLFAMDEAATDQDPSWCELFTEAGSDFLVESMAPQGYVSPENAEWLMQRISQDGAVKTATELELLVKCLEKAKSSPERLAAFALNQVKKAVLDGAGPLAGGKGALEPGRVNRVEAELMRRILYAFGGEGSVAVSRAEAEILFDINDAVAGADNDPLWNDLFVKAVANFMMAASGYSVPSRAEALRREDWVESSSGGVADFFSRMAAGGLSGILQSYREPSTEAVWADRNARAAEAQRTSETVTAEEAKWLAGRMGRDGSLHANEKALLRFIRDEAPSVHPSLQSLIAKAA